MRHIINIINEHTFTSLSQLSNNSYTPFQMNFSKENTKKKYNLLVVVSDSNLCLCILSIKTNSQTIVKN